MIPKIIHYCWFSGEPFPSKVQECIDSWHRHMPDWEFFLWDAAKIATIDNQWLRECLFVKKWAFAADFIRLYAVEKFGGIYLDTDCIVRMSLDPFLLHQCFIGREWYVHIDCFTTHHFLTSHCFGAEPHHPFIVRCLQYYDDRHFIRTFDDTLPANLRFDQTLLPQIQSQIATMMYGFDPNPSHTGVQQLECLQHTFQSTLVIYPYNYFDCYDYKPFSYVQHLALGGWSDHTRSEGGKVTLKYRIRYHFRKWLTRFLWRRGYILTPKQ